MFLHHYCHAGFWIWLQISPGILGVYLEQQGTQLHSLHMHTHTHTYTHTHITGSWTCTACSGPTPCTHTHTHTHKHTHTHTHTHTNTHTQTHTYTHRKLDTHGPRWTHPSLQEVLLGVPFLRHISTPMFEWLRYGFIPCWCSWLNWSLRAWGWLVYVTLLVLLLGRELFCGTSPHPCLNGSGSIHKCLCLSLRVCALVYWLSSSSKCGG
jgi:hypothetical protein